MQSVPDFNDLEGKKPYNFGIKSYKNSPCAIEAPLRFLILTLSHVNGEWTRDSLLK